MKNATSINILLDRSGSMSAIKDATVEGLKGFINSQKLIKGECKLTLVQFDSSNPQETVINDTDINLINVNNITFEPRGSTPLIYSLYTLVKSVGKRLSDLREKDRPDKVLIIVATDGAENCSMGITASQLKDVVELQEKAYNWQFIFLGANIDSLTEGAKIGISPMKSADFDFSPIGCSSMFGMTSDKISSYRTTNDVGCLEYSEKDRNTLKSSN